MLRTGRFSGIVGLLILLVPAWWAGGCGGVRSVSHSNKRPNVLFIAVDDLRPQLGCYGHPETLSPHIDQLAGEGVVFNRAYCQYPVCGPSRASLLSGVRPTKTRFRGNNASVGGEVPAAMTLPQVFKDSGYYTVSNGKIFHDTNDTEKVSWSEPPFTLIGDHMQMHDPESANYIGGRRNRGPFFEAADVSDETYIDGQVCEKAMADLQRLAKMDRPFFLACGFVRPHLPFYAPKRYWDMYDRDALVLADNRFRPQDAPDALQSSQEFFAYHDRNVPYNSDAFHKVSRHGYYACVSYTDTLVGRLLDELAAVGLDDNTIVVLWGDHGWNLGEHDFWSKHNLMHTSIRAPLIIRAPGYPSPARADGIVEFVDIYPTLCELAGLERPGHLEGLSMVPLLRDPGREWKQAAFIRHTNGDTVVTKDYIYTEYTTANTTETMLFDLKNDPAENVNVAGQAAYRPVKEDMSRLLRDGWSHALPENNPVRKSK